MHNVMLVDIVRIIASYLRPFQLATFLRGHENLNFVYDASVSPGLHVVNFRRIFDRFPNVIIVGINIVGSFEGYRGTLFEELGLSNLSNLRRINIMNLSHVWVKKNLAGLNKCVNLRYLEIDNNSYFDIRQLVDCVRIRHLRLPQSELDDGMNGECGYVSDVIRKFKHLRYIICRFGGMCDLSCLADCKKLRHVRFGDCDQWKVGWNKIVDVSALKKLRCVGFYEWTNLQRIDGLNECADLRELSFGSCRIDFKLNCCNLCVINLDNCECENLEFLAGCINLTHLEIVFCEELETLDGLNGCVELRSIELIECKCLKKINALKMASKLESFKMRYCRVESVDVLVNCGNLRTLHLEGCHNIDNVCELATHLNLEDVKIRNCGCLGNDRDVLM